MIKKFKYFLNESVKSYDSGYRHLAWLQLTDLCRETLIKDIQENWQTNKINPVIENILDEFLWRWDWRRAPKIQIINNVKHLVSNYLRDDGGVSIDGDKIVPYNIHLKKWNDENPKIKIIHEEDPYEEEEWEDDVVKPKPGNLCSYENNISQTGAAMWILEKYNIKIPCVIVKYTRQGEEKLNKCNSFSEALIEFEKYKTKMKADEFNSTMDMYIVVGEYSTHIVPILDV